MLNRLSLRLRVFLIFAALAAGLLVVLAGALLVAWRRLAGAGVNFMSDATPGATGALMAAAAISIFGTLALVVWVWFLFDQNVARPIETLAGGLRTGAAPDAAEGRYLADLAPAAREAAEARARSAEALAEAVQVHVDELARDKAMLESVLSDIGAAALMSDADGRVVFFNAAARQELPGLVLGRQLMRHLRPAALNAAERRLESSTHMATDLTVLTRDGRRLTGRMRAAGSGRVLILRPPAAPRRAEALESLRRHAATLVPMLDAAQDALPPEVRAAIRAEGAALIAALRALGPDHGAAQVDARALAASVEGVLLGEIADLCLKADGGALAALLSDLAARLRTSGRLASLEIAAGEGLAGGESSGEALVSLVWQGPALSMAQLDQWLAWAPDPDRPGESGTAIAAELGTGLWTEAQRGGGRIVMPLPARADICEIAPELTYQTLMATGDETLAGLTCVVFDTEATGLSPNDRIVQIAGLRIMAGRLTGERFETLVNPGRPIPPGSTKIHGITDAMVAGAPEMTEALRAFHHFAEDAVLVAHNAPFDMGLLRSAARETGIEFPNRVLDTVLLSAMLWGQSAPHALDALAERLGVVIPPDRRHTAMGDAEATAEIFLRLIPALAAKGLGDLDRVRDEARRHRRLIADANNIPR
ncbi:3'-5' exonuclease [Paracoccus lutimaris]|uniref:DNA-directed DNA polymerase n=1 Tax=Paracoccus lutimaris TaxID=1490030 RepID=A0A368ZA17_9RHOB|nr:exonuclease domain-containing protein [Paracoccus lutimaris]RCW88869.1 DNA polymerase-3 subunit epsilon [Paracoccus lutimaris]